MAVLIPASVGWILWLRQIGVDPQPAGAAIIFCVGLACAIIGCMDANRRIYLPAGIAAAIFAIFMTMVEPESLPSLGASFFGLYGLAYAAAIWWMTRESVQNSGEGEAANE